MTLQHSLLAPIQELERAYQFFNQKLFGNTLNEKIIITIQTGGRHKDVQAWYCKHRWIIGNSNSHKDVISEINFSAETLCLSDPYASLIHEMVHHSCALQRIKDTSRESRYHNKRFKEIAENAGLLCEYGTRRIGWAHTSLGVRAALAKEELKPRLEVFKYLRFEQEVKKQKKRQKNGVVNATVFGVRLVTTSRPNASIVAKSLLTIEPSRLGKRFASLIECALLGAQTKTPLPIFSSGVKFLFSKRQNC